MILTDLNIGGGFFSSRELQNHKTESFDSPLVVPSDPKKVQPISYDQYQEFRVDTSTSSITSLSQRRRNEKARIDYIRKGALEHAKEIVSEIEKAFESMVDDNFSIGKVCIRIYSEPGLSARQPLHKIEDMKQDPSLISSIDVMSFLGDSGNEMTAFIGEGFFLVDDYRKLTVIFDDDGLITRDWIIDCVLAHLCSHLAQAGYSLSDMSASKSCSGDQSYPEVSLCVTWAPELSESTDEVGGYRIGDIIEDENDDLPSGGGLRIDYV